jgi:hypothetical protein
MVKRGKAKGTSRGELPFYKLREEMGAMLEQGLITFNEFGVFSYLCIKANYVTKKITTSPGQVAFVTHIPRGTVENVFRSLERKRMIKRKLTRGQKGPYEVEITGYDSFDPDGRFLGLETSRRSSGDQNMPISTGKSTTPETPPGDRLETTNGKHAHSTGTSESDKIIDNRYLSTGESEDLVVDGCRLIPSSSTPRRSDGKCDLNEESEN